MTSSETLNLIRLIKCKKSLDKAKEAINQIATPENKLTLMKALRDRMFEIQYGVKIQ